MARKVFNVQQFIMDFSNKLLAAQGGGGIKDIESLRLAIRQSVGREKRLKIERSQEAIGASGVDTTASLFSGAAFEGQAAEAEQSRLTQLDTADADARTKAAAAAQQTALGALPSAQRSFEAANAPGFLSKVGGALIGGVFSSFLPILATRLLGPKLKDMVTGDKKDPGMGGISTPMSAMPGMDHSANPMGVGIESFLGTLSPEQKNAYFQATGGN